MGGSNLNDDKVSLQQQVNIDLKTTSYPNPVCSKEQLTYELTFNLGEDPKEIVTVDSITMQFSTSMNFDGVDFDTTGFQTFVSPDGMQIMFTFPNLYSDGFHRFKVFVTPKEDIAGQTILATIIFEGNFINETTSNNYTITQTVETGVISCSYRGLNLIDVFK